MGGECWPVRVDGGFAPVASGYSFVATPDEGTLPQFTLLAYQQARTAGAMALVLIRVVADFAKPVKEYGAAEGILLLPLFRLT